MTELAEIKRLTAQAQAAGRGVRASNPARAIDGRSHRTPSARGAKGAWYADHVRKLIRERGSSK